MNEKEYGLLYKDKMVFPAEWKDSNLIIKEPCTLHAAEKKAERVNRKIKNKIIFNRYCKYCHRFFSMSSRQMEWYKSKDLKLPKKCHLCRGKKKKDRTE